MADFIHQAIYGADKDGYHELITSVDLSEGERNDFRFAYGQFLEDSTQQRTMYWAHSLNVKDRYVFANCVTNRGGDALDPQMRAKRLMHVYFLPVHYAKEKLISPFEFFQNIQFESQLRDFSDVAHAKIETLPSIERPFPNHAVPQEFFGEVFYYLSRKRTIVVTPFSEWQRSRTDFAITVMSCIYYALSEVGVSIDIDPFDISFSTVDPKSLTDPYQATNMPRIVFASGEAFYRLRSNYASNFYFVECGKPNNDVLADINSYLLSQHAIARQALTEVEINAAREQIEHERLLAKRAKEKEETEKKITRFVTSLPFKKSDELISLYDGADEERRVALYRELASRAQAESKAQAISRQDYNRFNWLFGPAFLLPFPNVMGIETNFVEDMLKQFLSDGINLTDVNLNRWLSKKLTDEATNQYRHRTISWLVSQQKDSIHRCIIASMTDGKAKYPKNLFEKMKVLFWLLDFKIDSEGILDVEDKSLYEEIMRFLSEYIISKSWYSTWKKKIEKKRSIFQVRQILRGAEAFHEQTKTVPPVTKGREQPVQPKNKSWRKYALIGLAFLLVLVLSSYGIGFTGGKKHGEYGEGRIDGYNQGKAEGYEQGYSDAVAEAEKQIAEWQGRYEDYSRHIEEINADEANASVASQPNSEKPPRTIQFTIRYDAHTNGGQGSISDQKLSSREPVDLSIQAKKAGWEFVGWNMDKSAKVSMKSLEVQDSDITLYAIYKKVITVTFIDGNHSEKKTDELYNNESSIKIKTPKTSNKTDWTGEGWVIGTEDVGKYAVDANSDYEATADVTLYRQYKRDCTAVFMQPWKQEQTITVYWRANNPEQYSGSIKMPIGREGDPNFYWIPSDNPSIQLQPNDSYPLRGDVTFTGSKALDDV